MEVVVINLVGSQNTDKDDKLWQQARLRVQYMMAWISSGASQREMCGELPRCRAARRDGPRLTDHAPGYSTWLHCTDTGTCTVQDSRVTVQQTH